MAAKSISSGSWGATRLEKTPPNIIATMITKLTAPSGCCRQNSRMALRGRGISTGAGVDGASVVMAFRSAADVRRHVPNGSLHPCGGGTGRGVPQARQLTLDKCSGPLPPAWCFAATPLPVPPPQGGGEPRGARLVNSRFGVRGNERGLHVGASAV